uniref:Uncharacterized protein n=1 Tax=Moniliophthora roreri TaxID=221103 RepID=A0A0W0GEW5_MONRR
MSKQARADTQSPSPLLQLRHNTREVVH